MFIRAKSVSSLIQLIFVSPAARDRDERLRQLKDRQNEERQKKLEELKAQALAAQKYREQKEEERKRRIDDMRVRENDKRQQVTVKRIFSSLLGEFLIRPGVFRRLKTVRRRSWRPSATVAITLCARTRSARPVWRRSDATSGVR